MSYDTLRHGINDIRQHLTQTRKEVVGELMRLLPPTAYGSVRVPAELTDLIQDLSECDPAAHELSAAEYAYHLLLANNPHLFETRYVGIDLDDTTGITFIAQAAPVG